MLRSTLAVLILLIVCSLSVFAQTETENLLKALLDLPAPAPFGRENDSDPNNPKELPEEFFSKTNIPPDDAPIEQLLAYWARFNYSQGTANYNISPTEVVIQRIFEEIEKKPSLLTDYINLIPAKKEYVEFIKQFYDKNSARLENLKSSDDEEKPLMSVRDAIAAAEDMNQFSETISDENFVETYSLTQIKTWLTYNSKYFSDELIKKVSRIKDVDNYTRNKEELVALAKTDWESAEPILERLINDNSQPASATAAKWAYYAHYMFEKDERESSKYRRMLQDVVEDRKAAAGVRDLALDALVLEGEFEDRDEWYISLLEDETLYDLGSYTGLKTLITASPPEKWIPKMIELVNHKSSAVRNASVRNLVTLLGKAGDDQDKVILKALLPWLSNKNWVKENQNERTELIRAYSRISIPESIPSLILIVQNEIPSETEYSTDSNSNVSVAKVTSTSTIKNSLGETRSAAVSALASYKDSRAVPALLSVLDDLTERYERQTVVTAIIVCGGYSASQQLVYLESFARKIPTDESLESLEEIYYSEDAESYTPSEQIGMLISNSEDPSEDLVRLVIARIKTLQKSEPQVANALNTILQNWKSKVLDIERLNSIANNTADVETIIKTLTNREELRKNYPNQIFAMRGNGGVASGIATCILENKPDVLSVINSNDTNAQIAALACARLIRIQLPVQAIGPLLGNASPLTALAAERYLESEDSYEARNLVLSKYPGEAKILGARFAFIPNNKSGKYEKISLDGLFSSVNPERYFYNVEVKEIDKIQSKLQEEVKANSELLGIYAFLQDSASGHQILRLYKDKAVYSWYEDEARYRERIVSQEELKLIFDYVANKQIEDLKPIIMDCSHGCPSEEFVMFGRNGGRRIYIYSGYFYDQPLKGLKMIFSALEQGKSTLHYWLQDKIAGLEVLIQEKNIEAKSLWKNGDDFRVLILDKKLESQIEKELLKEEQNVRESIDYSDFDDRDEYYKQYEAINSQIAQRRSEKKYDPYVWRSVKDKELGRKVSQPVGDYSVTEDSGFPEVEYLENPTSSWNVRTSEFELRSGNYKKEGIWKVFRNGLTAQITKEGNYTNALVVSADGKWAITSKSGDEYYLKDIYRLNLQTGKEYKISIPKSFSNSPIAYIKSHNKFLIYSAGFGEFKDYPPYILNELKKQFSAEDIKNSKNMYYLVDPNNGTFNPVKGEFTPLEQITFRNLQQTANPDEFWSAIYDEKTKQTQIGRYNTKTFKFVVEMKIPEIKLTGMDIWVDEIEAKLYFIYEGHLLSLPLKQNEIPAK